MWLWYTETFATQIRQVAERLCWPHSNADVSLSDFLEEMPLWHMDSEATASWRKAPLWIILIFTTPQICKNIILDHNDLLFCGSCLHFFEEIRSSQYVTLHHWKPSLPTRTKESHYRAQNMFHRKLHLVCPVTVEAYELVKERVVAVQMMEWPQLAWA